MKETTNHIINISDPDPHILPSHVAKNLSEFLQHRKKFYMEECNCEMCRDILKCIKVRGKLNNPQSYEDDAIIYAYHNPAWGYTNYFGIWCDLTSESPSAVIDYYGYGFICDGNGKLREGDTDVFNCRYLSNRGTTMKETILATLFDMHFSYAKHHPDDWNDSDEE